MTVAESTEDALIEQGARTRALLKGRSVVLVGMMGAGKSSVGRRLAKVRALEESGT